MASYKERMLAKREEQKQRAENSDYIKVNRFKPERDPTGAECVTTIRILPYEDDGYPFFETHMLYELCKQADHWAFTEPYKTYDQENPIQHFLNDLYKDNKELYKAFRPQSAHNAWVIDKNDPEMSPQLWTLTYSQYKELEKFILEDENFSDIDLFSVTDGVDIKITTKHKIGDNGKVNMWNGKKTYQTLINPILKSQGPLISDKRGKINQEAIDELLQSLPRREEIFKVPSEEDMEEMLMKLRHKVLGDESSSSSGKVSGSQVSSDDEDDDDDDIDVASEFEDIMNS